MEIFVSPKNKRRFVKWILETAIVNEWVILLEYSNDNNLAYSIDNTYDYLKSIATEKKTPISSGHNYNSACKLTAIFNPVITDNSIDKIMALTHVLSVHTDKEMIFLMADDFHENCFSCNKEFLDKYKKELKRKTLLNKL